MKVTLVPDLFYDLDIVTFRDGSTKIEEEDKNGQRIVSAEMKLRKSYLMLYKRKPYRYVVVNISKYKLKIS